MRVPLIVRGPGIAAGQQFMEMVNNLDLVPTICDWAGITPGRVCDGTSLRKTLRGVDPPTPRTAILFENRFSTAVRTPEYVYVETPNEDQTLARELYDIRRDRDPSQMTSRHDDPAWAEVASYCAERLPTMARAVGKKANWVTATFPAAPG
jgi:arylsulfatase A-like enzyme